MYWRKRVSNQKRSDTITCNTINADSANIFTVVMPCIPVRYFVSTTVTGGVTEHLHLDTNNDSEGIELLNPVDPYTLLYTTSKA